MVDADYGELSFDGKHTNHPKRKARQLQAGVISSFDVDEHVDRGKLEVDDGEALVWLSYVRFTWVELNITSDAVAVVANTEEDELGVLVENDGSTNVETGQSRKVVGLAVVDRVDLVLQARRPRLAGRRNLTKPKHKEETFAMEGIIDEDEG